MNISGIQGMGGMNAMGAMRGMGEPPRSQPLTSEQKTQLEDILSEYDPASVTSDEAKKIFDAFREAGLRGPEVREAVAAAGFDADGLFKMAHGDRPAPATPPSGGQQVNLQALQSLQSILSQFDLTDISADEQNDLFSQLSKAGLIETGSVLNRGA